MMGKIWIVIEVDKELVEVETEKKTNEETGTETGHSSKNKTTFIV